MPREGRTWSDLDVAAMNLISQLREASGMPALRKMADETGIKFNRISDLLRQKNGTPTLQEFTTLCLLFGERPSRVLEQAMQTIEHNERTPTALAAMDPDRLADLIAADPAAYDIAALHDPYKDLERETPRD